MVIRLRVQEDEDHRLKASDVIQSPITNLQAKSATPTPYTQTITADEGYIGLSTVTVNPIPNNYGLITYNGSVITVS